MWVTIRENKLIRRKEGGGFETASLVVGKHQMNPLFKSEIMNSLQNRGEKFVLLHVSTIG